MACRLLVAVAVCCLWSTQSAEVLELSQSSVQHQYPGGAETAFDEGASENNPKSLFPGPTYGLPGYKESHNWISDYDIFSPLVFNAGWYAVQYDLEGKSENEIKKDWMAHLDDKTKIYPAGCRQGNELFSPQKYMRANPSMKDTLDKNDDDEVICGGIVRNYVKSDMFEGPSLYDASQENIAAQKNPDELKTEIIAIPIARVTSGKKSSTWKLSSQHRKSFGPAVINSASEYTMTFWFNPWSDPYHKSNILHHGDTKDEKAPMIDQMGRPQGSKLRFVVAQTNNDNFQCRANKKLERNKWTFVVLKVHKHKVEVEYNGDNVCTADNAGGSAKVLADRNLYVSSPWKDPAAGKVAMLQYYPGVIVKDSLLALDQTNQLKMLTAMDAK